LCPDDEVKEACRKSLVTEFFDETKLDDSAKSSELSGGQKQRIALIC
jgi:ABC-type multidrug transport system fused ATPase/permease subunit